MKNIGILEIAKIERARKSSNSFLYIEKMLVEEKFDWLKCYIENNTLYAQGFLTPLGCKKRYKIQLAYSYFFPFRFDKIWVVEPEIPFHTDIHMYNNKCLCLYYPGDLPLNRLTPLSSMVPWISEWLIKYEVWQSYKVWIGEAVKH